MKVAILLVSWVILCSTALAGLPEWASRFAISPSLGAKATSDRQLFSHLMIEYPSGGDKTEIRTHLVFLVGGSGSFADFHYMVPYTGEDFKSASAWIIEPKGKVRSADKDNLSHHLAGTDALYSDSKYATWFLNNIPAGSLVCLDHTLVTKVMVGCGQFYVQEAAWDADSSVIEFLLPPSWSVSLSYEAADSDRAVISGNRACFGKMKKWEEKPFGGSMDLSAARVHFKVYPNADAVPQKSWQEVSSETARNWAKLKDSIGELKYIAEQPVILESAIRRFEREFRYVAIEIGKGRLIPHLPKDVLKVKYGDCKDLSFFLRSALTEAGLKVYPVLVRIPYNDPFFPDYPSGLQFNHCIIAIVGESDTLYYDPTATGFDLGTLPPPDRNAYALWIKEDSPLIRLPDVPSNIPQTAALTGQLNTEGHFAGTLKIGYACQRRNLAAIFPTRQSMEDEIRRLLRRNYVIEIMSTDTSEARRELSAGISLKNFARVINSNIYCNPYPFNVIEDSVENLAAGYFVSAVDPMVTDVTLEFPDGAVLPKDTVLSYESEVGSTAFTSHADGRMLTTRWSYRFLSRHYDRSGKPGLDSLLHGMHKQQSLAMKFALRP
ncbi:hypothetical protein EHM69_06540 [candidate division KSB1 bacterium]|nr:MAG: hypothetical protein EHM69_06540 [candidate division KSB1 bacterium]